MSKLADKILRRFVANRPTRLIEVNGEPYLARVYLWHSKRGWRVYLHFFVSSDGDRWLHDHPFHGFSVVLSGGYDEERMTALSLPEPEYKVRRVRWFNILPARTFHRIASMRGATWTLFINSPHHKRWGFLRTSTVADGESKRDRLTYDNPYDETGVGGGAPWWETAPSFKDLGV